MKKKMRFRIDLNCNEPKCKSCVQIMEVVKGEKILQHYCHYQKRMINPSHTCKQHDFAPF